MPPTLPNVPKPCQPHSFLNFSWAEILPLIKYNFQHVFGLLEVKKLDSFFFYNFPNFTTLENKKIYFSNPENSEFFFGHKLHF